MPGRPGFGRKAPRHALPCLAMRDAGMRREIRGLPDRRPFGEITRRGRHHPPYLADLGRDQPGIRQMRDAERDIHALIGQPDDTVEQQIPHLHVLLLGQELVDDGPQDARAEHHRRGHRQQSARRRLRAGRREIGLLQVRQDPPARDRVALAGLAQPQRPRRPVQQFHPDLVLEKSDRPGDRRGRAVQPPRRPRQAAFIDRGNKSPDRVDPVQFSTSRKDDLRRIAILPPAAKDLSAASVPPSRGHPPMSSTIETTTASPWHEGELRLQRRAGAVEKMDDLGRRWVRDHLTDQQREFYPQLPFVVLGAVDPAGDVWATLRAGQPGFLSAPDPAHLHLALPREPADPADAGMDDGDAIALLGIQLSTRRRNRMNGTIARTGAGGFTLAVRQAYGNCAQYIQLRDFTFTADPAASSASPAGRARSSRPGRAGDHPAGGYVLRRLLCRGGGQHAPGRRLASRRQIRLRAVGCRRHADDSRFRGQPVLQHARQFPDQSDAPAWSSSISTAATCCN